MLRIIVNEQRHEFEEGISILDALRRIGIDVPTLCHDDRLKPADACRLCEVELDGHGNPVPACSTKLADGMTIRTHTPELENLRRGLLEFLARRYPSASVDQFPDKPFHKLVKAYGVEVGQGEPHEDGYIDLTHPYIRADFNRCVSCWRCVRICDEVQGQNVWKILARGTSSHVVAESEAPLLNTSCVSCGACVDTCPSGALEDVSVLEHGLPTGWTRTTCPYCGTGCEMNVGVRGNRIVSSVPVLDAPVNKGHLCVKGRYALDFVQADDRITEPMIRVGDGWKPVSWEEAADAVAQAFQRIETTHGPDRVGLLGSARATNEENYLVQKFARLVLGTNNVDCCARVCHAPTAAAMKMTLGTGAATNSYDDIERAATILVAGCNPTENHPIIGARIKQAVLNGARLIVVDPRRIELAEHADIHLQLRPGTNILLFNALAAAVVEEGLADESFIAERVAEYEEFRRFVAEFSPERIADRCGVEAEAIRRAARLYATQTPSMCLHGLGMTEHVQGTDGVMTLVNLALLTGNLGKPGAGVNPLRGQNNVQGAAHMGCEPASLTGAQPLAAGRELVESVWKSSVPERKGLNLMEMMDAAERGELKALWAVGYDIFLTNADAARTRRALEKLETVVVQDMFLTETARAFGTIFLPCASSFEKDGTFMNAERRIQRVRKAIEPLGNSKPDWEITCLVARAMGRGSGFEFDSPEEVWNEIRAVWPAGRGITYARMEHGGLQWPCPTEDHPGTTILHADTFPIGKRTALRRIEYRPTPETVDDEFPMLLTTGRTLHQFNAGTMTGRTKNMVLRPSDTLDISSEDADRLNVTDGERVRLRSRHGEAMLPARISPTVKTGELFATFHTPGVFLNFVTGPHRDAHVGAPEYKVTAVRVEKPNVTGSG